MTRVSLAMLLLAVIGSEASSQVFVPYGVYSFGPRVGMGYGVGVGYGYGGGYLGPSNYLPVPGYYGRASLPGPSGPRPVTWYTPGLGYATNVQTGLPWHGPTPTPARAYASQPYGYAGDPALARQDRVRRRMETLYAVNHHQLGRDYPKYLDQALVANSKWKKQQAASTEASVAKASSQSEQPGTKPAEAPTQPTVEKDAPATLPAAAEEPEPAPAKPSKPRRILD